MNKAKRFVSGSGCLVSVLGPLLAILLYPRAKWLFAFVLIGVAFLILDVLLRKDPTPQALADWIEGLLAGNFKAWDVDDYENLGLRDPQLKEFWHKSMSIGGLPEEWVRLGEQQKHQMLEIIQDLRRLGEAKEAAARHRTLDPKQ